MTRKQIKFSELSGSTPLTVFRLENADGTVWGNSNQFFIHFGMNFSETFVIYVDVETSAGHR